MREPKKRLNMHQLKKKSWFATRVNFGQIKHHAKKPPFVPSKGSTQSTSSVNDEDDAAVAYDDKTNKWKQWDYIDTHAFQHEIVEWLQWKAQKDNSKGRFGGGGKSNSCALS